jgi:hypothetical protein
MRDGPQLTPTHSHINKPRDERAERHTSLPTVAPCSHPLTATSCYVRGRGCMTVMA